MNVLNGQRWKRRHLLRVGAASLIAAGSGCARREKLPPFLPMHDLSERLRAHSISAADTARHLLGRVQELDRQGPELRAVIEINPDAMALATALDQAGEGRGPLHGCPIFIKDNIDSADALHTTAGSLALMDSRPRKDAFIVSRLRAAGMLILGKTNLSEWANIRSPHSTSGWSARGGLTKHPYRLDHNPSGSSSGSAVAVAAGLTPAAIGTETNGSIVSPSSVCGIVGLKPTRGLVSRSGIIPISLWQDSAGPMARTVRDAALLLNVIAGTDPADEATAAAAGHLDDFTSCLRDGALRGARLGVARNLCGSHSGVAALFDQALRALREAGAVIVDELALPHAEDIGRPSMMALLTELRGDLNAYLQGREGAVRSLADVIAFNRSHRAQEMPYFGQEFFEQAERLGAPDLRQAGAEARAEALQLAGPSGIDALLRTQRLDAIICPTNDPAWKTDLAKGDSDVRCASTPAAVAGYPHLTVPMGLVGGLPVGLSFMGAAWTEARLLGFGHAYERVRGALQPPSFAVS